MGRKLPPLPKGAPARPPDNRYREQYGVVVMCRSEPHQRRVYRSLRRRGYRDLRIVVT